MPIPIKDSSILLAKVYGMLTHFRNFAQKFVLDWGEREALKKYKEKMKWEQYEYLEDVVKFVCWNNVPGDYLEFGCYSANTFRSSYHFFCKHRGYVASVLNDRDLAVFQAERPRFFAFDSFEGLPPPNDLDVHPYTPKHWQQASYSMSREDFETALRKDGINMDDVVIVDGWYESTLNNKTIEKNNMKLASVINIDCDLYESSLKCLNFVTPMVQDGTVIIFDDYNYYRGSPSLGERRAFREWLAANPRITATELVRQGFERVAFFLSLESQ